MATPPTPAAAPAAAQTPDQLAGRTIVLPPDLGAREGFTQKLRTPMIMVGVVAVLVLGAFVGHRFAAIMPELVAQDSAEPPPLIERVDGGLYTLELAMPQGQARWMLEFDADIVTQQGPTNPQELRDALEKLVIQASSLPLVQTAPEPNVEMRKAILTIAKHYYPWLVDIHMRRSDIRAPSNKLKAIGEAMRGEH